MYLLHVLANIVSNNRKKNLRLIPIIGIFVKKNKNYGKEYINITR